MNQVTKESASAELLPCPFCGGVAHMEEQEAHSHGLMFGGLPIMPDHPGSFTIECRRAGCNTGQIADTRDEVMTMWNRRTPRAESADYAELRRIVAAATPGPWEWWTSNSVLRLTGGDGKDGGVLYAYSHKGHADVTCSAENRAFIATFNPAKVLAMIDRLEELEKK